MAKKLVWVLLGGLFIFLIPGRVLAVCVVPGPHIATNTTVANIREIRNSYGSNNCQIATTIILTDRTINDTGKTQEILRAAKESNLKLTIRIYGAPSAQSATTLGRNLSTAIATTGMQGSVVEFGNEVNLPNEGFVSAQSYAQAYTNFVRNCLSCQVYLPALGGTSLDDKAKFAKTIMSNLPSDAVSATKGIIFNSGAGSGREAVTDWKKTLNAWQQAGLKTDNLRFFLTEVGPPNSNIKINNIDQFVKEAQAEFLKIKDAEKLEGMTFFFWDEQENKYMVFIDADAKGNLIKKRLTGEGNLDPSAESQPLAVGRAVPGAKTGKAEDYPEESKQQCEYGTGGASGAVPKYKKANGEVVDAERTDTGLNFATTVPGIQCGQVKSDPITLQEIVPYSLLSQPTCENIHNWSGNLEIQNVVTPFAKAIADHWVGTLDAEHFKEEEIDKMTSEQRLKYSGVLGKLLTQEQKDKLRADFIDYVKKQGAKSMYANMTIYGTKITDIKKPEKASDDRKAWDKIPFFPNEQVSGQVKFNVCGDQQYRTYPAYQELMRLGLAGNQLFKLLQPEDVQKKYFSANPDLQEPYKYLVNFNSQNPTPIANAQTPTPISKSQESKRETIFDRVKNFLAGIVGKAKEVLAAPNGKCFHLEVSADANNNATVCLVSDSGKDGDIQFDINGVSLGQFAFNYKFHGGKYCWNPIKVPAGGTAGFHAKLDNCGDLGNEEACTISADASGKVSTTCKPGLPPAPPVELLACSPTKDGCDPTCNICKLARYGPPFTVDGNPNEKTMNSKNLDIGTVNYTWDKTKDVEGWKKTPRTRPAGCTVGPWGKDANGNKTQCINDDGCSLDEGCRGGFCGALECEKDHDRTVNVYNNVPYLYSLWDQSAGGGAGFLNLFKPWETGTEAFEKFIKAVKETPLPEGCSTDEGVVFDKFGNFSPAPGAAKVKYVFEETGKQGVKSVTMTTPPERNLMFYRLGGVCNANKWFSEKVLAPVK